MSKHTIFILLSLFILTNNQECIFGQNCPYNQGFCVDTKCECIEGYYTFMQKDLPLESQTFCNYEQTSLYLPLFLEFFLPSLGHLYVGKYWFALLKFVLGATSFLTGYYLTGKIEIPNLVETF